jgi:cytochrome c biogenesis factor
MPLPMYDKFFVIIIIVVVITFIATIAGTTITVVGQQQQKNQTVNLTALFTQATNNDTTTTTETPTNNTAANMTTTTTVNATNVTATDNMTIEDARKLYLSVWNQTEFNATFSTFVEPFSAAGYGVYEERSNVFAPGETIVLYVEPVGFAHRQIDEEGGNNNTLYFMNMTADYEISAANGTELQLIEDVQAGSITSHRPNTEMPLTLTITPEVQPLPIGDYIITYSVTDEVSGESFDLEKEITVAERE